MRSAFRPAAVILTTAATVIATVIRILVTPNMQDVSTGTFHVSYVVIGILLVSIAAIFALVLASKGALPHTDRLTKRNRMPIAVSSLLFGSVLVITSLFDAWIWLGFGMTPPPNEAVISKLDAITLALTLLFGVLAGLFMVLLGFMLMSRGAKKSAGLSLGALLPVAWIWVRLVRYEVSYASAIQVAQSFYDFVMLIFTMLFLFAFARYISRTGERSSQMLLAYALCTALLSLSGPLTELALFTTGETEAYNASRLAGFSDFCMGIFALSTALTLVFARVLPEKEAVEDAPAELELGEDKSNEEDVLLQEPRPTVEDILRDLKKQDSMDVMNDQI